MKTSMIVGRLHVSFDRGTKTNRANDLGLEARPSRTEDGGLVRGLGTHFRDEQAYENAKAMSREEVRIRDAFRRRFLSSPIPGIYVITEKGAGQELLDSLEIPTAIAAHVSEYELALTDDLPPIEILEWVDRVKRQILDVQLGKKEEPAAEGLKTLAGLAGCPVLDKETREYLLGLIADAKLKAITRIEVKRCLEFMDVKLAGQVTPRRVQVGAPVEVEGNTSPRRGMKAEGEAA